MPKMSERELRALREKVGREHVALAWHPVSKGIEWLAEALPPDAPILEDARTIKRLLAEFWRKYIPEEGNDEQSVK